MDDLQSYAVWRLITGSDEASGRRIELTGYDNEIAIGLMCVFVLALVAYWLYERRVEKKRVAVVRKYKNSS